MGPSRARLEKFVPIQDLVIFARRTAEDHEAPRRETVLEHRDLTQRVIGDRGSPDHRAVAARIIYKACLCLELLRAGIPFRPL
jgi:hypothetical protein